MKKLLAFITLTVCFVGLQQASADLVTDWNAIALETIRARNTPPPMAARNLAILHTAMFDAINGIQGTYEPYLATGEVSPGASPEAAASTAAHDVLASLYPSDQATYDVFHALVVAALPDNPRRRSGVLWGSRVAAQFLAARADDGSANSLPWPGSLEPGQWRPTVSFGGVVRPALLPHWGAVQPLVIPGGSSFPPPAPPALASERYAWELNQVRQLGAYDSSVRTPDQTETALFWGYGPGSATPPGHWNQIAQIVIGRRQHKLEDSARLFALLNLALADSGIACWNCKYLHNYWRPITAIELADTDGNPLTEPEAGWVPLLPTPPFPEYTSGHSTFSGAAATVLALFFGTDQVPFSAHSDDLPGVVRSYGSFSQAAQESGISRIYGGIHFASGNANGLALGANIGTYVANTALLPRHGRGRR